MFNASEDTYQTPNPRAKGDRTMCNATSPAVVELARLLRSLGGHGPHGTRKGL
jgi:hypothetical protein